MLLTFGVLMGKTQVLRKSLSVSKCTCIQFDSLILGDKNDLNVANEKKLKSPSYHLIPDNTSDLLKAVGKLSSQFRWFTIAKIELYFVF